VARTTARRVGRYELVREIGRGGMSTVYLARQSDLAQLPQVQRGARLQTHSVRVSLALEEVLRGDMNGGMVLASPLSRSTT
jgi:serine/threonine protein kinase